MANITDVARRAGVSTATVSRVLTQPDMVTPATRQRVLQAVQRLDYTPNAAAKNLRRLRTACLLVTVPDISNPFFSLILQGIEDVAQREGYSVLVGDTQHDPSREESYAQMLKQDVGGKRIFSCANCGKLFVAADRRATYCTESCAGIMQKQRQRRKRQRA